MAAMSNNSSSTYKRLDSGNVRADGSVTAAGKGGVCVDTASKNAQFKKLRTMRENTICFDCPNTRPTWASVNHGVFLCLDCSATHRSMGVHLTFVRSIDLDEWTQRQIDAMRIGGNGPARAYFRKHGVSLDGGKGTEKKYRSKAATMYRAELEKLVEAEARKRGEGTTAASAEQEDEGGSLLQNLTLGDAKQTEDVARQKLEAARSASRQSTPAKPTLKLASAMPGASKLAVGGNLKKPGTTTSSAMMLKKKTSSGSLGGATRLRVNKLGGTKLATNGSLGKDESSGAAAKNTIDDFEDIEQTQRAAAEAEKEKKQMEEDEALARKLQEELDSGVAETPTSPSRYSNGTPPRPVKSTTAAPSSVSASSSPEKPALTKKHSSMDESMAKLKGMTGDFFSGM